jgi:hypothetical protein
MSDEDVGEESDEDADGNCDHVEEGDEEGDEDGVEDGDEEGDEEGVEDGDEEGNEDGVEDGDEEGDEEDVGEEGADGRLGSALGTHLCGKDGCTKPMWHSGICTSVLGYRRDQKPVQKYTAEPAPSPRELMRQARNEGRLPPSKKPILGDRVRGKYQGQIGGRNWFDGVVTAVHEDGTCDLHYDDGDCEERVAPRFIKAIAEDETLDREEPEEVAEPEEQEEVEVVVLEDNVPVEEGDEVEDGDARESLIEDQGREDGRTTPNENLETTFWVQCDRCCKWRRLLNGSSSLHSSLHSSSLDGEWTCANSVLRAYSCEDDESECH